MIASGDVLAKTFSRPHLRRGYDETEVDILLDEIATALRHYEGLEPATGAVIDSDAVATKVFTVTKYRRGYDPVQVDAFIDQVLTTLRRHERAGYR